MHENLRSLPEKVLKLFLTINHEIKTRLPEVLFIEKMKFNLIYLHQMNLVYPYKIYIYT